MAVWKHVETRVLFPRQTHHPPSNIPVRISVLIALSNVRVNVLRAHLCVGLAVFQTVKGSTMQFVMVIASQATKNAMVSLLVLRVHLSVTVTVGAKNGTLFVMESVKANGNHVMGRVMRVTSIVMEAVEIKGIGRFVMGNVNPNTNLVMGGVQRVTSNAMETVGVKNTLDCAMVNAYGILIPVMASVVRGIFHVMVTMVEKDATMKSITKTVMENVFGIPSHVRLRILLLA